MPKVNLELFCRSAGIDEEGVRCMHELNRGRVCPYSEKDVQKEGIEYVLKDCPFFNANPKAMRSYEFGE